MLDIQFMKKMNKKTKGKHVHQIYEEVLAEEVPKYPCLYKKKKKSSNKKDFVKNTTEKVAEDLKFADNGKYNLF